MIYRVIGTMSGSSLDGMDIVFAEVEETGGSWNYIIKSAECVEYSLEWQGKLRNAANLSAYDYQLLHAEYGHFIGSIINRFIDDNHLHHKVQLISFHGHTVFHQPSSRMTAQIGDGAAVAAVTGINVVSDLRSMDVALGGQGAPIVPVGEKLLFNQYPYFLNLGGICNISAFNDNVAPVAFDICPSNYILNFLAEKQQLRFDNNGNMASKGNIHTKLLTELNALKYYHEPYPKSLSNQFSANNIIPLINNYNLPVNDSLRTYTEHIVQQITYALNFLHRPGSDVTQMMVTGGGAHNEFLVQRIRQSIQPLGIEVVLPDDTIIKFKEALIMGLLAILRWREENTAISSITGSVRNSIGGAVWMGQEA